MSTQLLKNAIELITISLFVCMFIQYVPCTIIHEGVHYMIGYLDPNVECMEVHLFDKYTSIMSPGRVMYKLKVPSTSTIVPISTNEAIAYTVSLTFLCVCMWVFVSKYVRWRGPVFVFNKYRGGTV